MADPDCDPLAQPERDLDLLPDPGWKVVLYNDDVTPMEVVVFAVMKAAGLSAEVAEMVTLEAHHSGAAVVRRGLDEVEANGICHLLVSFSQIAGLCPGVDCEALHGD